MDKTWICTDSCQAVKQNTENSFEVVEVVLVAPKTAKKVNHYGISQVSVNLDEFSEEGISHCLNSFGYESVEEVKKLYGESANQIIAECIAEMHPEILDITFETEEQALKYIEENITEGKVFSQ